MYANPDMPDEGRSLEVGCESLQVSSPLTNGEESSERKTNDLLVSPITTPSSLEESETQAPVPLLLPKETMAVSAEEGSGSSCQQRLPSPGQLLKTSHSNSSLQDTFSDDSLGSAEKASARLRHNQEVEASGKLFYWIICLMFII